MFWRLLSGALRHGLGRLSVGFFAVALGATLVSAVLNLSFDVGPQVGRQLRRYGANIVLRPLEKGEDGSPSSDRGVLPAATMNQEALADLDRVGDVVGFAPFLYLVVDIGSRSIVMAGTSFGRARAVNLWWRLATGRWPEAPSEAVIGADGARALGVGAGDRMVVRFGNERRSLELVGILETGGAEDGQILARLADVQSLAGQPGQVTLVQVSALTNRRPIRETLAAIKARLPGVGGNVLARFAGAESDLLTRVRRLVALVAMLVLVVATLTVGSTMATRMMERREEIGLWKALGADRLQVVGLFLAEALSMGLAGGLMGYLGGIALAEFVGWRVFQAAPALLPLGLPITVAVAAAAAVMATFWPVRSALAVDPAVTLRGE